MVCKLGSQLPLGFQPLTNTACLCLCNPTQVRALAAKSITSNTLAEELQAVRSLRRVSSSLCSSRTASCDEDCTPFYTWARCCESLAPAAVPGVAAGRCVFVV